MARYDVYPNPAGEGFLLDVQADALDALNSRVVVPLIEAKSAPKPAGRLNPVFQIEGKDHVMVTQFLAAVAVFHLGPPTTSLAENGEAITNALDTLLTGI